MYLFKQQSEPVGGEPRSTKASSHRMAARSGGFQQLCLQPAMTPAATAARVLTLIGGGADWILDGGQLVREGKAAQRDLYFILIQNGYQLTYRT
jgi:hypothetical protein